jgi:polysaccharide biosynthesis transport protein
MTSLATSSAGAGAVERSGFRRYYRVVVEHLRVIAACVAITLAAAVIYVEVAPRTYTAESQLLINPAAQTNTVLFSLPVLHSSGDPTQDVLTASALITTPQVANSVIHALHLHITAADLLGRIQSTPVAQSNIIALQATAPSARDAQRLANTFALEAIAVRTSALHNALALQIPGLRASVAALAPAVRNGPGTLGDQLNQLEQLQHANDPTISIASVATLPTGPSSPQKALSVAAGLFAGLLLGLGAAFLFDSLDPRLRREEQLRERFANAPVLARIPRIKPHRGHIVGPLTPIDLPPAALEQYRTLRASLTASRAAGSRAVLMTGSVPSEGKTTSAISLAAVLAQSGASVILIEADLRRPTIGVALGLGEFSGAEQVLAGEIALDSALVPVRLGSVEMRVLAAHPHSSAQADRLSPAAARRLVEDAKALADFVIIDSAPLTAVIDAMPIAQAADAVIVAARVGHSRLNKLSDLFELLERQQAMTLGVVLVGVDQERGYGYDYYQPSGDQMSPLSYGDAGTSVANSPSHPSKQDPSPRRPRRRAGRA